ncbi:MAG: putative phage abortive infection protein [Bacteroides xylanisolvens]
MEITTNFFSIHLKKILVHAIFTIVSLYILIAFRNDVLPLIPSYFNSAITTWINLILFIAATLYLIIAPLFLIVRLKPMRQAPIVGLVIFIFIYLPMVTVILLIPIFEFTCTTILHRNISISEFGSFFAGITGLLAFWGVLYSLDVSEKRADKVEKDSRDRYNEDSERNIFFQLLELHTNKVNAIEFNEKRGAEAFKEFVDIANKSLNLLFMGKAIMMNCTNIDKDSMVEICNNKRELFYLMKTVYKVYHNGSFCTFPLNNDNIDTALQRIKNMLQDVRNKKLVSYISGRYDDSFILPYLKETINEYNENKYEYTKLVADFLYKEYGHILGHYFRNMYYVMDTINNFSDKKNYRELFRAQLSRYELTLGIFNAVSSNSSPKMVQLLEEFDIFKDVYPDDLTLLQAATDDLNSQSIIRSILNEYKSNHQNT